MSSFRYEVQFNGHDEIAEQLNVIRAALDDYSIRSLGFAQNTQEGLQAVSARFNAWSDVLNTRRDTLGLASSILKNSIDAYRTAEQNANDNIQQAVDSAARGAGGTGGIGPGGGNRPGGEAPDGEASEREAPGGEVPDREAPGGEVPGGEVPGGRVPGGEAPGGEAPGSGYIGDDRGGFDRDGFDNNGFDRSGFDRDGFDRNGFDRNGFDSEGFDRNGFDRNGFDSEGFDSEGFDRNGFDRNGIYRGDVETGDDAYNSDDTGTEPDIGVAPPDMEMGGGAMPDIPPMPEMDSGMDSGAGSGGGGGFVPPEIDDLYDEPLDFEDGLGNSELGYDAAAYDTDDAYSNQDDANLYDGTEGSSGTYAGAVDGYAGYDEEADGGILSGVGMPLAAAGGVAAGAAVGAGIYSKKSGADGKNSKNKDGESDVATTPVIEAQKSSGTFAGDLNGQYMILGSAITLAFAGMSIASAVLTKDKEKPKDDRFRIGYGISAIFTDYDDFLKRNTIISKG